MEPGAGAESSSWRLQTRLEKVGMVVAAIQRQQAGQAWGLYADTD